MDRNGRVMFRDMSYDCDRAMTSSMEEAIGLGRPRAPRRGSPLTAHPGPRSACRRASRRGSSANSARCVMPADQQQRQLVGATSAPSPADADDQVFSARALRAQSGGGGDRLSIGRTASRRRSSASGLEAGGLMAVYSESASGSVKFRTMEEKQEELRTDAARRAEAESAVATNRL